MTNMREKTRGVARLIVAICITIAFLFLIYSLASADNGKEIYLVSSNCNDNGLELVFYVNSADSPGTLHYAYGNIEPEDIGLGKWRYVDFLQSGKYAITFANLEDGQGILKNPTEEIVCEKDIETPAESLFGLLIAVFFVVAMFVLTFIAYYWVKKFMLKL